MKEHTPEAPRGAGEVITFLLGAALPVLSVGILVNEVMRVTVGAFGSSQLGMPRALFCCGFAKCRCT